MSSIAPPTSFARSARIPPIASLAGRRTAFAALIALAISGCGDATRGPIATPADVIATPADATATPAASGSAPALIVESDIVPPAGFRLDRRDTELPPMIAALVRAESTTPIAVDSRIYVPAPDAGGITASGAITLTAVTYAASSGALATYNGWFAEYGFPAAAERATLGFGETAERFDLEWPALHAVIARSDTRFVLVVGDASIPANIRSAAMESLARAEIDAGSDAP